MLSRGNLGRAAIAAVVAGVVSKVVFAAGTISFQTIAVSNTAAPGTPSGVKFSTFSAPQLSENGMVAFTGTLQTGSGINSLNSVGIWSGTSVSVNNVVRMGSTQVPGEPTGATFNTLYNPVINASGSIAFGAYLEPNNSLGVPNYTGIWSQQSGGLSIDCLEGNAAPGTGSLIFQGFPNSNNTITPLILDSGGVAFHASLAANGSIDTSEGDGVWTQASGSLALIAQSGTQAPGTTAGSVYQYLQGLGTSPNGKSIFQSQLVVDGTIVTTSDAWGLWSDRGGSLALTNRESDTLPGSPNIVLGSSGNPAINQSGTIAFSAGATDINTHNTRAGGIFSDKGGTLTQIVQLDNLIPGTLYGVNAIDQPVIDAAGDVAFRATTTYNVTNEPSIWSNRGGTLQPLAFYQMAIPGIASSDTFIDTTDPSINSAGMVAFMGTLKTGTGDATTSNNLGLWAQDPSGNLDLVVRKGDLFQVAPGDQRTISVIYFNGLLDGDGNGSDFNDASELTFGLKFSDGSSGVFTAFVPEPTTMLLPLVGIGLLRRGHRRHIEL